MIADDHPRERTAKLPRESGAKPSGESRGERPNPAYVGVRRDLVARIPADARRVLDVGCSVGMLGDVLKRERNDVIVDGIEADPVMAEQARNRLDDVVCADVETLRFDELGEYDCIVFGDVLEHLVDPWGVLARAAGRLRTGGTVVISVPNVRHFTTLVNLILWGTWPRRARGLFDRTHLRWFTLRSVREMCDEAHLTITGIRRSCRLVDSPHAINALAVLLAFPPIREFVAYQYVVTARKRE